MQGNEISLEAWVPIAISILSLILAGVALGWNIYRDVVLKAKVRVRFSVVSIVGDGGKWGPSRLRISVTNHGPGPVRIQMVSGKVAPWWRRLLRRPKQFVVLQDHTDPLSAKLPNKLEVGDSIDILLPHDEKSFLAGDASHIGVSDSFGRLHMAPRHDLKQAIEQFRKDFPEAADRSGG